MAVGVLPGVEALHGCWSAARDLTLAPGCRRLLAMAARSDCRQAPGTTPNTSDTCKDAIKAHVAAGSGVVLSDDCIRLRADLWWPIP